MLAIVAAILFFLAFIFRIAEIGNDAFNYVGLALLGLMCLALHCAGIGPGWSWRRTAP